MNKSKLLKYVVLLMLFIFSAQNLSIDANGDYITWWFDMVMHFLSGVWVGLFFIWFFSIKNLPWPRWSAGLNISELIFRTILFVFVVGVVWEFFEFYVNNHLSLIPFDSLDTFSDLILDLLGGVLAVFFWYTKGDGKNS